METEADSPKQTWYDCLYLLKGSSNVTEMRSQAAPGVETADKLFSEFLARVNKKSILF